MTDIGAVVLRFQPPDLSEYDRFRSWEHCYRFFGSAADTHSEEFVDLAALHLAAYMASWGMYRGSGFLLQYAYPVHQQAVRCVLDPAYARLRSDELGAGVTDAELASMILRLAAEVRDAYRPFAMDNGSRPPSDVLVTKVILGTSGAMPAVDRFVRAGLVAEGFRSTCLGPELIDALGRFARANLDAFRGEQQRLEADRGVHYPLMKVVDMYLWQRGRDTSP
jgi:hypothetical protein